MQIYNFLTLKFRMGCCCSKAVPVENFNQQKNSDDTSKLDKDNNPAPNTNNNSNQNSLNVPTIQDKSQKNDAFDADKKIMTDGGNEMSDSSILNSSLNHDSQNINRYDSAISTLSAENQKYFQSSMEMTEEDLMYNLAGYQFEGIIKTGRNSEVVKMAKDGISYAVKVLDLEQATINFLQAKTHDPKEEAAIMKRFDHPHVVRLFDFIDDTDNNRIYIVMEYLSGGTILECNSLEEKKEAFSQALAAVQYIHYQRIAHRDIKPQNILRDSEGTIRLVDFGISVFVPEGTRRIPVEMALTPHFAPPEMFQNAQYDPFSGDIWSLGVTLYNLLFNKLPFEGNSLFELQDSIKNKEPVYPEDGDSDAIDLLKRMLTKNPKHRIKINEMWEHPYLNFMQSTSSMKSMLKVSSRIFESLSSSDTKNSVTRISRGSLRNSLRGSLVGLPDASRKIKKANQINKTQSQLMESPRAKKPKPKPKPHKPRKPSQKKTDKPKKPKTPVQPVE